MELSTFKNNREKAIALINEGNATKESLMADLGVTDKSLASLFAQLRLMGHYPFKGEDGVYSFITEEEFEALKESRKSKAPAKVRTPEEQFAMAQKRETKAASAATNAIARYNGNPTRENELRKIIAEAELELASILLGKLEESHSVAESDVNIL